MELGNLLPLYFGRQEFVAPDLGDFAIYRSISKCLLGVQEIFANTSFARQRFALFQQLSLPWKSALSS